MSLFKAKLIYLACLYIAVYCNLQASPHAIKSTMESCEDICTICCDKKVNRILPCTHKMCATCVEKSFARKRECPFCRYNLTRHESPLNLDHRSVSPSTQSTSSSAPNRPYPLRESREQALKIYFIKIKKGNLREVRRLRGNYSINVKNHQGNTPFHIAAKYGQMKMVRMLIKHQGDINSTNIYGQSPLHLAFDNRHEGVVKYLIRKGARTDIKDMWGKNYRGL